MKNNIKTLLSIFFLAAFAILAKAETPVQSGFYERDGEQRPGIRAVFDASPDEVKDAFEDYMKDKYDVKLKGTGLFTNKDELYAEKVIIEQIINKNINFYARIVESETTEDQTTMTLFASLGYDVYINQEDYKDGFQTMMNMATQFVSTFVPAYHEEKISATQEELEDLTEELEEYNEEMADSQEQIEDLKKKIEKLKKKADKKKEAVEEQKAILRKQEARYQAAKKSMANK